MHHFKSTPILTPSAIFDTYPHGGGHGPRSLHRPARPRAGLEGCKGPGGPSEQSERSDRSSSVRAGPALETVVISRRSGAPTVLERTPSPELASSDRARSVLARRRARTLPGAELLALWSPLATFVAAGSP